MARKVLPKMIFLLFFQFHLTSFEVFPRLTIVPQSHLTTVVEQVCRMQLISYVVKTDMSLESNHKPLAVFASAHLPTPNLLYIG